MKFLVVLFALIAAVFAIPQHYGGQPSAPFIKPGFGGIFNGIPANTQVSSQVFTSGGGYPVGGALANALGATASNANPGLRTLKNVINS